jgi:hypothetical protein
MSRGDYMLYSDSFRNTRYCGFYGLKNHVGEFPTMKPLD